MFVEMIYVCYSSERIGSVFVGPFELYPSRFYTRQGYRGLTGLDDVTRLKRLPKPLPNTLPIVPYNAAKSGVGEITVERALTTLSCTSMLITSRSDSESSIFEMVIPG